MGLLMEENKMNIFRKTACIGALVLALSGEGCATIANTVTGPPVMTIKFEKYMYTSRKEHITKNNKTPIVVNTLMHYIIWSIGTPISFVAGGLVGLTHGAIADIYFLEHHKYPEGYSPLNYDSWGIKDLE